MLITDWKSFAGEAAGGSLKYVLIMAAIIIPVMVLLELARESGWLEKFAARVQPALKVFGLSPESSYPLLAGFIFGISYGAGVIIDSARSGRMTVRDMVLVNIFLSVCHAVVEDTALFLALGANPLVIIPGRLAAALLITYLVSRSIFIRRCGESPKAGG
jgi:hypothetical protein